VTLGQAMNESPNSQPAIRMQDMADALALLRDSWVNLSLVLKDYLTEQTSPQRDEVLTEVERYLCRLRESERRHGS
jgi:hypothetical protein